MKDSKSDLQDESTDFTLGDLSTFQSVIAIAGCNMDSNKAKSETLFLALPQVVHLIFEKWETITYPHFNSVRLVFIFLRNSVFIKFHYC